MILEAQGYVCGDDNYCVLIVDIPEQCESDRSAILFAAWQWIGACCEDGVADDCVYAVIDQDNHRHVDWLSYGDPATSNRGYIYMTRQS
jgi:hypothetical protein